MKEKLKPEHLKIGTVYIRPDFSKGYRTIIEIKGDRWNYKEDGEISDSLNNDIGELFNCYLISLPKEEPCYWW